MNINDTKFKGLHFIFNQYNKNNPTIIFLHDSLGCVELWRDFPQKLAAQCQCNYLIYDRHGYGKSSAFTDKNRGLDYMEKEAEILVSLIEECQINNAILFGHSDGASIALLAASLGLDAIRAVISVGAHVFVEDVTLKGIRKAKLDYQTTNLKEKLEKYHGDKTEAMFKAWAVTWTAPFFASWNIEYCLPKIHIPVFVIQGALDEFGSAEQVKRIEQQVSGRSKSWLIPGLKHSPHKEQPVLILDETTAFIQQNVLESKKAEG